MRNNLLKVGVIGLGVGLHHLKAYDNNKNCKIFAICDFDKNKLTKAKKKYPKTIFTSNPDELFSNKELDIISIASFDNFHFNHLKSAIINKKHIFIEKPLCLTKKELIQIEKLRKRYPKKVISSNMVLRANPRFGYLKKLYEENKFNKLYFIEADYYWGRVEKLFGWRARISNYSLILGASIHLIDLILWIINKKPVFVQAFGNRIGSNKNMINSNTFSSIILTFKDNLYVKINAHGLCVHPHFHSIKFFSSNSTFIHQFNNAFFIENKKIKNITNKPYPFKENRHEIIDSFINAIRGNKESKLLVSFKSIFDTMSICLAAIDSEKKGKITRIKYY